MRKLKIAVVASGNIPSLWANSINTVRHADAFSKLGHEVELLSVQRRLEQTFSLEDDDIWAHYGVDPLPLKYFVEYSPFYFNNASLITKAELFLSRYLPRARSLFPCPEKAISRHIETKDVDLCFARSYKIVKYNIKNNIPTIIETHNPYPERNLDLRKAIELSKNNKLVVFSTIHEKIKAKLVGLGLDDACVLVNEDAVNKEAFDSIKEDVPELRDGLGIPQNKKVIMYLGSLKKGKGIHKVIETSCQIKSDDVVFYIVGGADEEVAHWREYSELKGSNNVRFTGFVQGNQVPRYLKAADILFMPYDISESNAVMDFETTSPIKLFEYMASKKPIVSTNLPVIEKVLSSDSSAILVGDENYAGAICRLLNDNKLSECLANSSYQKTGEFTYKTRCSRILDKWVSVYGGAN